MKLRTGRGVYHAEGIGEDELREGKAGTEMRGVLFWVNLARKDKHAEPTAQILEPEDVPVRHEGDAIVRVLVGEGSPVELGTPGLILDVELPKGGSFRSPVPSDFNGFMYMLEGEASFGANTAPGPPLADCSSRIGSGGVRGRGASRDALHAHGRKAVRRDARLQRAIRGLIDDEQDPDRSRGSAERLGLCGVSCIRRLVVPPSSLRPVRPRRLLRLFAIPARQPARGRCRASGRPELRARRRLVLGLRERELRERAGPGSAATITRSNSRSPVPGVAYPETGSGTCTDTVRQPRS